MITMTLFHTIEHILWIVILVALAIITLGIASVVAKITFLPSIEKVFRKKGKNDNNEIN